MYYVCVCALYIAACRKERGTLRIPMDSLVLDAPCEDAARAVEHQVSKKENCGFGGSGAKYVFTASAWKAWILRKTAWRKKAVSIESSNLRANNENWHL